MAAELVERNGAAVEHLGIVGLDLGRLIELVQRLGRLAQRKLDAAQADKAIQSLLDVVRALIGTRGLLRCVRGNERIAELEARLNRERIFARQIAQNVHRAC